MANCTVYKYFWLCMAFACVYVLNAPSSIHIAITVQLDNKGQETTNTLSRVKYLIDPLYGSGFKLASVILFCV